MQLERLSSRAMLALCEYWLQEPRLRAQLRSNDLGVAIRARLRDVYVDLVELYAPHLVFGLRSLHVASAPPDDELLALARRLYQDLRARLANEADGALARRIVALQELLFPHGLDASGAQRTEQRTGQRPGQRTDQRPGQRTGQRSEQRSLARDDNTEWFTRLRSVEVSEHTLMEAYRAWAVVEDRLSQRARKYGLHDSSGRTLSAAAKVRKKWSRTVRGLHTALGLIPMAEYTRAELRATLEHSVRTISSQAIAGAAAPVSTPTLPDFLLPRTVSSDEFDDQDTLEFDAAAFDGAFDEPEEPQPAPAP